mgnify:CR=1 FL=1
MMSNLESLKTDVCVFGMGFAGMNAARLLAKQGFSSVLIDGGFGASNFWAGTVDVMNSSKPNGKLDLKSHLQQNPHQSGMPVPVLQVLVALHTAVPLQVVFRL